MLQNQPLLDIFTKLIKTNNCHNGSRTIRVMLNFFVGSLQFDSFFKQIFMCDERWVLFDKRKRSRQWLDKDKDPKPSLHPKRLMQIFWWSYAGLLHYRCLNSDETINSEVYVKNF
ncbi:SETMAR [Cordylochernes scorpioides]|uniref:SETMAR n=1 Tax=Cordylochernes scorpioides TaxID=51811 RepID=A0ABY6KQC1_9ARAC|nr:SETMAR [Cordylochernes scorpioides]